MAEIKIAGLSELREGIILTRETPRCRVGLTISDGQVFAFRDACTHDDSPLDDGEVEHCQITCAGHGARFDLRTGAVIDPPAVEELEVYPVRLGENGEDIFITLP